MFEVILDMPSCLDRPPPHGGISYPPPDILTSCYYKLFSSLHIYDSLYTDTMQHACLLWLKTNDPKGQDRD